MPSDKLVARGIVVVQAAAPDAIWFIQFMSDGKCLNCVILETVHLRKYIVFSKLCNCFDPQFSGEEDLYTQVAFFVHRREL